MTLLHRKRWLARVFLVIFMAFVACSAFAVSLQDETTDVLVVGGSPSGVAAALAAARQGARVVLTESRPFLGTVLTAAMLNTFDMDRWYPQVSTVRGIFEEIYRVLGLTFDPMDARRLFAEKVAKEPRITLYLETQPVAPLQDGDIVKGMVVRHFLFFRQIHAKIVIDATDDADVAAFSGVPYGLGREQGGVDKAMQPATLLFRVKKINWENVVRYIDEHDKPLQGGIDRGYAWGYHDIVQHFDSKDFRIEALDLNLGGMRDGSAWINALQIFDVDGTDLKSREEAYIRAKEVIPLFVEFLRRFAPGFERAELTEIAPELYIRETRHIHGMVVLGAKDIIEERLFWDRIAVASYPIDLHPYHRGVKDPFSAARHVYTIPLRSLIPIKVDNLFVASRSFSATSVAAGSARVVPTTMALGQAAGVAAAMCAKENKLPRRFATNEADVRDLQDRLLRSGVQLNL